MIKNYSFFLCAIMMIGIATLANKASGQDRWSDRWNKLSLRVFAGSVDNGGTIDERAGYKELKMKSELEWGGAFSIIMGRYFDLDFALHVMSSDGDQHSVDSNNRIKVDLDFIRAAITAKLRYPLADGLFVPWVGAGPDIGYLMTDETEVVDVNGLPYEKDDRDRSNVAFGGHVGCGLDIYPLRESAFALTIDGRYSFYTTSGSFDGDLNTFGIYFGIRWDFLQRGY
jgi:hypothetical protein